MLDWVGLVRPCAPWAWVIRSGSSRSSWCALSVAEFVGLRMDRPGAPWRSSGFLCFVHFRTGGCCVRSGTSGSSGSSAGRLVYSGSSGSFW